MSSPLHIENRVVAEQDADAIHRACKGAGTQDTHLISTICSRPKQHLTNVDMVFREKYSLTLLEQIVAECRGDYKQFLISCVTPADRVLADMLHKACTGLMTNEKTIIDIFCSCDAQEIEGMKITYEALYGKNVTDVLQSKLHRDFEDLFVQLATHPRQDGNMPDENLARHQAERLQHAAKGFGTDEKVFVEILSTSSRVQVQAIKHAYQSGYGKSLEAMIKSEFKGKLEKALLALLWPTTASYSAFRLHKAMRGLGTDEKTIIFFVGGKDKPEVKRIANEYGRMFNTRLVDDLQKEISGHFFEAVQCWIESP